MAQLSSQFASISPGMSTEEAQTGLVSLIKAWDIDVKDVERQLMDNINTLGNKFALTNKDIIEGMERAGATLSVIGTSVQDSFALFTGAQEVIQNAETVGTALKTLSLRIRGYDEETEELSDDVIEATGKVADLTKVAENNYAGVSLWADAAQTQYRSLKDYLGDIAKIFDKIDAASQTKLLESLFGKRGASVGSSILRNFNQVERAIEEMENAAGAADKEMDIIRESWQYKINALKETWVGTFQSLVDRGVIGDIIDGLTNISEAIQSIVNNKVALAGMVSVIGGIASSVKGLDSYSFFKDIKKISLGDKLTKTGNFFSGLFSGLSFLDVNIASTVEVFEKLKTGAVDAQQSFDALNDTEKNLINNVDISSTTVDQFGNALESMSDGANLAKAATNALINSLLMIGAQALIAGIMYVSDKLANMAENTSEAAKAIRDEMQSAKDTADANLKTFDELSPRLEKLSKGVDDFGNNLSLTDKEYDEFKSISQTIAEMSPDLIKGYNDQNEAIVDLKGNVTELRKEYEKAQASAYSLAIAGTDKNGKSKLSTLNDEFLNTYRNPDWGGLIGIIGGGSYYRNPSTQEGIELLQLLRDKSDGTFQTFDNLIRSYQKRNQQYDVADLKHWLKEIGVSYEDPAEMAKVINSLLNSLEATKKANLKEWRDSVLVRILKQEGSEYYDLSEEAQSVINYVVNNIDEETAKILVRKGNGDIIAWVQDQIDYVNSLPKEIVAKYKTVNLDTPVEDIKALIEEIKALPGFDPKNPIYLYLQSVYDDRVDEENKALNKVMGGKYSASERGRILAQEDPEGQISSWIRSLETEDLNLILSADTSPINRSFNEILNWYERLKRKNADYSKETNATISESVKQLATQIDPYFDEIGSFYNKIFAGGYNTLDKSVLDNDTLNSLRSTFEEISEEIEMTFDPQIVDDFWHELKNAENAEEAHEAINSLATEWLNASDTIKSINEDTTQYMITQMNNWGVKNAEEVVESRLLYNQLIPLFEQLEVAQNELNNAKEEERDGIQATINSLEKEIAMRAEESIATEAAKIALLNLKMIQQGLTLDGVDSSEDVEAILEIATACGIAGEAFKRLQGVLNAKLSYENLISQGASAEMISRARYEYEQVLNKSDFNLENMISDVDLVSAAKDAGSGAGEATVDAFQEALKNLQYLRDNDVITLKHYLDQEKKLIDDFYRAGKMSAEDYFKYVHDWLREMQELYKSVISDVTSLLQKEIDKLEKERDKEIKQLEEQRDAELEVLDEQIEKQEEKIKLKQKELDELKKANDERKRELDLQKALYELERAKNQRTLLRYQEGSDGKSQLVYRPDEFAIREKSEEVEEQKYQKRISILEKELDLLNEQKDTLEEQRQAIEDHYQELIDKTNDYYDQAIERIEEYMSRWEELAEIEERALMQSRIESLGLSIDDILALDEGSFEAFKENYLGILSDIYRENDSMTKALGDNAGQISSYLEKMQPYFDSLQNIDLTSVATAMATVAPALQTIADCMPNLVPGELQGSIQEAANALGETETNATGAGGALETAGTKGVEAGNSTKTNFAEANEEINNTTKSLIEDGEENTSLNSGMDIVKEKSNTAIGGEEGVKGDFNKTGVAVEETTTKLNKFHDDLEAFTSKAYIFDIQVKTTGMSFFTKGVANFFKDDPFGKDLGGHYIAEYKGTVGDAFFNGYPGLNSSAQNALRSEFGQPELTVYPNGTYELTTTPTFSDLPKDTVIFNEEQTNRILKNSKSKGFRGKSFASGSSPYLSLQEVMPDKANMFARFESKLQDNLDKMKVNIADMTSNVRDIATAVTSHTINNNGTSVHVGDINVTCPGVTETEVARNLGVAIKSELNGMVSGMALRANQIAMRR